MLYTDQTGYQFTLTKKPARIVSLVPSQTELLHALGLQEEVIGITKFCVHPEAWFRTKQRVGGTKDFKTELILDLRPDLILANKEENTHQGIASLRPHVPVWTSDIHTLEEALDMITTVGEICDRKTSADLLVTEIRSAFSTLSPPDTSTRKRTAYMIWKDPWMLAGTDTFIADLLRHCGLECYTREARYPETTPDALKNDPPDLLLLSSEPYPFTAADVQTLRTATGIRDIRLVDGEYFSWYGARLLSAPSYFGSLRLYTSGGH